MAYMMHRPRIPALKKNFTANSEASDLAVVNLPLAVLIVTVGVLMLLCILMFLKRACHRICHRTRPCRMDDIELSDVVVHSRHHQLPPTTTAREGRRAESTDPWTLPSFRWHGYCPCSRHQLQRLPQRYKPAETPSENPPRRPRSSYKKKVTIL